MHLSAQAKWVVGSFLATVLTASSAHAGMTVYGLTDAYRLRLEEISFFVVLLLSSALAFKFLWNHAVKDVSFLPRIRYFQSLCLCLLLGLATLLILTMISGIREVLTPEAWRRQGSSYRLSDPAQEPTRQRSLEHLRAALFDYARGHGGNFPPNDFIPDIPAKLWEAPDQEGTRYIYTGGLSTNDPTAIVAVEPKTFGDARLVLTAGGTIEKLTTDEIVRRTWHSGKP